MKNSFPTYVPVNSKTPHPPWKITGHLTFLKNLGQIPRYVASLDGHMPHPLERQRGSNLQPYLVQLVFAAHFKQRHIPRYNYMKRKQQKNPRGIDKNNDP